jgi:Holliday junction resolvase RusA-like endonuclease
MDADPRIKDYRADIQNAWLRTYRDEPLWHTPLLMHLTFIFGRPDSHYKAAAPTLKREARTELMALAPYYQVHYPDLDKLVRAVGDALTGFAYADDRQVCQVHAAKVFGDVDTTVIEVMEMEDDDEA